MRPYAQRKSGSISWREKSLWACLAATLVVLPWSYGGILLWAQFLAAGLSFGGLAIAASEKAGWTRLRRFPPFWLGLALALYVCILGINTSFVYVSSGNQWWLETQKALSFLPSGMKVPFKDAGPWRFLLQNFPVWAMLCGAGCLLEHKRSVVGLLNVLVANGLLLAAYGIVQRASGITQLPGLYRLDQGDFFALFVYKNHAAVYFTLLLTTAIGLALQNVLRSDALPGNHGPAVVQTLAGFIAGVAVVLTASFSGVGMLVLCLSFLAPYTAVHLHERFKHQRSMYLRLLFVGGLLTVVSVIGCAAGLERVKDKISLKLHGELEESARSRAFAAKQGVEMFLAKPLTGWGAGCFRYGFTKYAKAEEAAGGRRNFWQHTHNDWLETLIELGVAGCLPLAALLFYWTSKALRLRLWRNPWCTWLSLPLLVLGAYALIDFPFQNPAVACTVAALTALVCRWRELEIAAPSTSPLTRQNSDAI